MSDLQSGDVVVCVFNGARKHPLGVILRAAPELTVGQNYNVLDVCAPDHWGEVVIVVRGVEPPKCDMIGELTVHYAGYWEGRFRRVYRPDGGLENLLRQPILENA
jgi:hypothetical protein